MVHDASIAHERSLMPVRPQTEAIYRQIGETIARLRRERRWTQERLATAIGIQPNYLARIETAAKNATLDTLVAAAEALGVPFAALLGEGGAAQSTIVPPQLLAAARGLDEPDLALLVDLSAAVRRHAAPRAARRARGRRGASR